MEHGSRIEVGEHDYKTKARSILSPVEEVPGQRNGSVPEQEDFQRFTDLAEGASAALRDRSNTVPRTGAKTTLHTNGDGPRQYTSTSIGLEGSDGVQEVRKLSAAQLEELTSDANAIPIRVVPAERARPVVVKLEKNEAAFSMSEQIQERTILTGDSKTTIRPEAVTQSPIVSVNTQEPLSTENLQKLANSLRRPTTNIRSLSSPIAPQTPHSYPVRQRATTSRKNSSQQEDRVDSRKQYGDSTSQRKKQDRTADSRSTRDALPIPPFSLPTHLHLELSSARPSPLYIEQETSKRSPYEPARVKFERLMNFLLIPPHLERILLFGALTCLDTWLYTFTILPLRFLKALALLLDWMRKAAVEEAKNMLRFIYSGAGRFWQRHWNQKDVEGPRYQKLKHSSMDELLERLKALKARSDSDVVDEQREQYSYGNRTASTLLPTHKADLIQGLLIITACSLLMRFDASRMYHSVRGQAAIKLYVIYNVLEVCDRLFSALGQDIIECLFSQETLERKADGRSKITRPFWMFILALIYTVIHATALLYQVITLNVAVNSYSNALLTLLMSNQFVEIKGAVFKKFEKENLFQLTCADVVERFQLWLMLFIIALRNIVEMGGLSIPTFESFAGPIMPTSSPNSNTSAGPTTFVSSRSFGILPHAFTVLPSLIPAQVLVPFLLVLGSEMLVDWLKHAYITKFNAVRPAIYSRFLDILAKDYYSNAFASQNLTRRLGLPVIPLTCLFIRAALQTYHMFLATNMPTTTHFIDSATSLSPNATSAPALAQIDHIIRSALGRSSFGGGSSLRPSPSPYPWPLSIFTDWTVDDLIALSTMALFFGAVYFVLLAFKLILGMLLLRFARGRYRGMKAREQERVVEKDCKRVGGWATVELGDERRKVIYEGDEAGLEKMRDRDARNRDREKPGEGKDRGLEGVDRYSMVAKRIW